MVANPFMSNFSAKQVNPPQEEELRRKKKNRTRKASKQGWFKPGTEKPHAEKRRGVEKEHDVKILDGENNEAEIIEAEVYDEETKPFEGDDLREKVICEGIPEEDMEPELTERKNSVSTTTTASSSATDLTAPVTPRCVSMVDSAEFAGQRLLCTPSSVTSTPQRSVTSMRSTRSIQSPGNNSRLCSKSGSPSVEESQGSRGAFSRTTSTRRCVPTSTSLDENSEQSRGTTSRSSLSRMASVRSCVPSAPFVDENSERTEGSMPRCSILRSSSVRNCKPDAAETQGTIPSPPTVSEGVESNSCSMNESTNQIVDALMDALDNDNMSDVSLLGRDGARVRATKFVMACQSPALQKVLYYDPRATEVYVGPYGEPAIRALKDFCCTGVLTLTLGQQNAVVARSLTELASLAHMFQLQRLYQAAEKELKKLLSAAPSYAVASYDAASGLSQLQIYLIGLFRSQSSDLFLEKDSLKYLSHLRLGDLVTDLEYDSDTNKLLYIRKWLEVNGSTPSNVSRAKYVASRKLKLEDLLQDRTWEHVVRSTGFFEGDEIDRMLEEITDDGADADDEEDMSDEESVVANQPNRRRSNPGQSIEKICFQLTLTGDVIVVNTDESEVLDLLYELR